MKLQVTTCALQVTALLGVVNAAPQAATTGDTHDDSTLTSVQAASNAGAPSANTYPPAGTKVNSILFPPESVVGFAGPTPTGAEPAAIETAPSYPYNNGDANQFPLIRPQPHGKSASADEFDISKHWGNLSPWYSLRSSDYGLPDADPRAPKGCDITQMHLLYRHGARYPTTGAAPEKFAQKIANATKTGLSVSGELSFLQDWTYKLGAELLTPFGRSQNFLLGVAYRELYGHLLNNFTEMGTLPVFRTQSQDRMVKTAENFAAGFFGVPEYLDQVSISKIVEAPGVNNSGASYETCTNSNVASRGSIGSTVATAFSLNAFNATIARLQTQISGLTLTPADAISMLQLCSYETHALGYSAFCPLFTQQDFLNYEYYYDLSFYYSNGPGSPVSAAQGKGYLSEYLARFEQSYPQPEYPDSSVNKTYSSNSTFFPLNQSIYADATHEVIVLDTLMAFNLTALFAGPPLSPTGNEQRNSFRASAIVPFATHFTTQVLSCPAKTPTKQIRFVINDAVIPLDESHAGCEADKDGLCAFDTVVDVLRKREAEIDWTYDCYANYTATPGQDYNGRAPRS